MSDGFPITVVKVGGRELIPGAGLGGLVSWAARQVHRGHALVVVHGGGEEVTDRAGRLGLDTQKRDGLRVTSDSMLEVVAEVLGGRVNLRLTNALEGAGVPAVGLSGVSARMLTVRPAGRPPGSLGWVGEPTSVRTRLILRLLEDGYTPVVAPLGSDGAGGVYNVNADAAAAVLAARLRAQLLLLTDVPGVRTANGEVVSELSVGDARRLLTDGTAHDGMVPKLSAAIRALNEGSPGVWIGNLDALEEGTTGGTRLAPIRRAFLAPLLPIRVQAGT